jgi:hypothetical protein
VPGGENLCAAPWPIRAVPNARPIGKDEGGSEVAEVGSISLRRHKKLREFRWRIVGVKSDGFTRLRFKNRSKYEANQKENYNGPFGHGFMLSQMRRAEKLFGRSFDNRSRLPFLVPVLLAFIAFYRKVTLWRQR